MKRSSFLFAKPCNPKSKRGPKAQPRGVFNGLARIFDQASFVSRVLRTRMQPIKFAKKTQGFGVTMETQPTMVACASTLTITTIWRIYPTSPFSYVV
jgi:hypothetical protein